MENTIRHITQNLVEKLPDDVQYYKLRELHKNGFPQFVVARIKMEVERNLDASVTLPQIELADMRADNVQQAWEQFFNTVRSEAHLPKRYTHEIVKAAISDILNILVRPRQSLPSIIFRTSNTLKYDQLIKNSEVIVVYRHFTTLLLRYMEKKDIETLARDRCTKVLAQIDEKLTKSYTPLNWAQMLEPLFILLNEQIDSDLLRLFFQDKKMHRVARRFERINKPLNRAELIEILSSPDLLNMSGYEEDQNDLFEQPLAGSSATEPEEETESDISRSHENLVNPTDKYEEEFPASTSGDNENDTETDRSYTEKESLNARFNEEKEQGETKVENIVESPPDTNKREQGALNEVFTDEEDEQKEQENRLSDNGGRQDIIEEKAYYETGESVLTSDKSEQENGLNTPIWKRFMSSEEMDDQDESGYVEGTEMEQDFDEVEEPIIDLTKDNELKQGKIARLNTFLDDDRGRFVKKIFGGTEQAYEEAIEEIASKEDWQSASRYVDRYVFKRNMIDMYSEAAVDFTDRLQSFFIEMTKSN